MLRISPQNEPFSVAMTAKIEPNKVSSPRRKWLLLFDCGLDSELSRLPPTTAAAVAEVPRAISEKPEDIPNSEVGPAVLRPSTIHINTKLYRAGSCC